MKGYSKNNSPVGYCNRRDGYKNLKEQHHALMKNRDIYILKLNPKTGFYKHIDTISPEREVLNGIYGCKYFLPKNSHEELREKAYSLYAKEDHVFLTDNAVTRTDYSGLTGCYSYTYCLYDGFYKIWDKEWLFNPEFVKPNTFEIDLNLYTDCKEESSLIDSKELNSEPSPFFYVSIFVGLLIFLIIMAFIE
ncbi:MAG: hypothetical protein EKK64_06830 [Neisseriaceae bacterium]|nr:MAG: hypothetical protein EKK64_06830 [Neisseriaceae bacterium]